MGAARRAPGESDVHRESRYDHGVAVGALKCDIRPGSGADAWPTRAKLRNFGHGLSLMSPLVHAGR